MVLLYRLFLTGGGFCKSFEDDQFPLVLIERDGGVSAVFASGGDRFFDAAAGCEHGTIGDFKVAYCAGLPTHNDMAACGDRA